MRQTQKAVSGIAYQTPEFFSAKTNELRASSLLGPVLWVAHKGEGADKPHIHFLCLPGPKPYNLDGLDTLWGVQVVNGCKASVSAMFRKCSERNYSDWLLYSVHNPKYLASKGLEREFSYSWDDLCVTAGDEDIRDRLISESRDDLDNLGDRTTRRLILLAKQGMTWREVVLSGMVPMGQLSQASHAWEIIYHTYSKLEGANNDEH